MPATITSESSTSPVEFNMATVYKICVGPIEPADQHLHCVACLGLAHAEAALDESDCGHCADLPARVLRARCDMVRGLFGVGLTAAAEAHFPAADDEIQILVGAWLFPTEGYPQASACGGDCYCSSPGARCPEESVGSR